MNTILPGLAPIQLERIADGVEQRAFNGDVEATLRGIALGSQSEAVAQELREYLVAPVVTGLSTVLRAVAAERRAATLSADQRLELVWTGPERDGTATRDTAVVVRELFQSAETDVLVAGYALYNARSIFAPLAERMLANPGLRVRLIVNVARDDASLNMDASLRGFALRLKMHHWPAGPLPTVYYDPRAFDAKPACRAVMHAKCVLVDGMRSFLTSANLTEAAQMRNIELGVVINDAAWCRAVTEQFDDLIAREALRELEI
jgi:phosphatidylserine/phosphatidylglycerophosphate/cardiolipin synthase-like enzyme